MEMISGEQVHALLPYDELIPALSAEHERDVDAVESTLLEQPAVGGGSDNFLALPAWQRGRAIGAKLVTVFPANEHNGSGLPSVQAVYALFDGTNGRPLAMIDGTALTLRKTAADSGVGSRYLARRDAATLTMIGAGAMAPHLIQAHIAACPSIREVQIWNRTPARAATLAKELEIPGVIITATDDLQQACGADIVSCATMATQPLVLGEWLQPGAHLDLVGSYRPDMHECDTAAMVRGSVFADSPWSALRDCGEVLTAIETGALQRSDILATSFDLARGAHPGRRDAAEITVFQNGGGGHLDLMVAQVLMSRAG